MTYEEAIGVINEYTNSVHDEQCFEVGNCDVKAKAEEARRRVGLNIVALARINQAETVITAHLKQYDAEQIIPNAG
ncbi:MAG TPA: hypothetical protein VJS44_08130 [Pyrinomonadaceae bacterium]|nr:hypothetical protein [Pyrinomonadaceae bacterium]